MVDITGCRSGKLVASQPTNIRRSGQVMWICLCDCGSTVLVRGVHITGGTTKSCGCLRLGNRNGLKHGMSSSKEYAMLDGARQRSKRKGWDCDLELEDIVIPDVCPLLNVPMKSPSLDRIDNSKGYTKDNVWVISKRANTIKGDATLAELKTLVAALEKRKG